MPEISGFELGKESCRSHGGRRGLAVPQARRGGEEADRWGRPGSVRRSERGCGLSSVRVRGPQDRGWGRARAVLARWAAVCWACAEGGVGRFLGLGLVGFSSFPIPFLFSFSTNPN